MLLLFCAIAWIVTTAGWTLAGWLGLPETSTRTERNLIGFALGLDCWLMACWCIGLLGLLYPAGRPAVGGRRWRLLGGPEGTHGAMARDDGVVASDTAVPGWGWLAAALFAGLCAWWRSPASLSPPTLFEWDSLSYHLAVPKIYLQRSI